MFKIVLFVWACFSKIGNICGGLKAKKNEEAVRRETEKVRRRGGDEYQLERLNVFFLKM